jgi:Zn-dependent metalloprotease
LRKPFWVSFLAHYYWITAIFQKEGGWQSAILNFAANSKDFRKLYSMKVETRIVLQNVEELISIFQNVKKKIGSKAHSNISASFDFFTKIPKIYEKWYFTKPLHE